MNVTSEAIEQGASTMPQIRHQKKKVFFDPKKLPWTEWVMPRTWFKLLNVDMKTGGFTMLLKVDRDNSAPIHHHLGAIEGIIIEGEFGYDDDRGGPGWYAWEDTGVIHSPTTTSGFVMFTIAHGPLAGYNEDGSIGGFIDAELMLNLARANNAADHISGPLLYEFR